MKSDQVKSVLMIAAAGAAAFIAWRAYSKAASTAGAVSDMIAGAWNTAAQAVEQGVANVSSAWNNNVAGPFARGQAWANGETPYVSEKSWLYSDYSYTGIDPTTKQPILSGEWYGNAEARRYEYEQRAAGGAPAATSNNGAAFGIYPKAWGSTSTTYATQADVRRIDNALGW